MLNHNNLKQIRARALLSKAELARKAGVSVLTITRIEQGMECRMDTMRKSYKRWGIRLNRDGWCFRGLIKANDKNIQ